MTLRLTQDEALPEPRTIVGEDTDQVYEDADGIEIYGPIWVRGFDLTLNAPLVTGYPDSQQRPPSLSTSGPPPGDPPPAPPDQQQHANGYDANDPSAQGSNSGAIYISVKDVTSAMPPLYARGGTGQGGQRGGRGGPGEDGPTYQVGRPGYTGGAGNQGGTGGPGGLIEIRCRNVKTPIVTTDVRGGDGGVAGQGGLGGPGGKGGPIPSPGGNAPNGPTGPTGAASIAGLQGQDGSVTFPTT